MPLRAFVDEQEVVAPLLSEEAWEALRERVLAEKLVVMLPCCDTPGYLRRSRLGTRHFAHKRSTSADGVRCEMEGETLEHLKAKAEIVRAAKEAGYVAAPEIPGDGWRADVMATRPNGTGRIAFEVQWSFLKFEDCLFRQERYARDQVRGCWFFRNPPPVLIRASDGGPELKALRDLPIFHLHSNATRDFTVSLNHEAYTLDHFVQALLHSDIRFCQIAQAKPIQPLRFAFLEILCERCGRYSHLYHVDTRLVSSCGIVFKAQDSWYSDTFAFHPQIRAAAAELVDKSSWLHMGEIKERTSSRETATYTSFGCTHCDAILDRTYVEMTLYGGHRLMQAYDTDSYVVDVTFDQPPTAALPHWCYPSESAFCCRD